MQLILPNGAYRFRADLNGTQFWSGESNHCTVPGCTEAGITVTVPVTIRCRTPTASQRGIARLRLLRRELHGYNGTTDAAGQVQLTLPLGDYRFRSNLTGTQFWSGGTDHCTCPGAKPRTVIVTLPVTVTVTDTDVVPQEGLPVYVFDGAAYTGYNGVADAAGQLVSTLPQGDYRFRSDRNGTQFWSGGTDHCTRFCRPTGDRAVVGLPAPELGAVPVRSEAVVALRQGEDHPAGGVGQAVVAGEGRPVEHVDRQSLLRDGVGVRHRHGDGSVTTTVAASRPGNEQ